MRVLVLPLFGVSNVDADSNHLAWMGFLGRARERYERMFVYYGAPEGCKDFRAEHADFVYREGPKIFLHQEGFAGTQFYRLFNALSGKYPIDAVLTSRTGAVPAIHRMIVGRQNFWTEVPVILYEPGVGQMGHELFREESPLGFHRAVCYSYGYNIFLSESEKKLAADLVRRYMAPSVFQRFWDRSIAAGFNGVDCARIDGEERVENEKPVLFYGGRFNRTKGIRDIVKMYDGFFRAAMDVEIVMTTPSPGTGFLFDDRDYPGIRFIFNCDSERFLQEAKRADVFMVASEYEGRGLGFFELIYRGVVGIFPDRPWSRAALPKDFPFFYRGKREARDLLLWVVQNRNEAREMLEPTRTFIRDEYNLKECLDPVFALLERAVEEAKGTTWRDGGEKARTGSVYELVEDFCSKQGDREFSLMEVLAHVVEQSALYQAKTFDETAYISDKFRSKFHIHRMITERGWEDQCTGLIPTYRRVSDG